MGRTRKRFNDKARSNAGESNSNEEKMSVEVKLDLSREKYDESNPLVLSSTKKKAAKVPEKKQKIKKPLSKKQRKLLEKVLERKKKKLNRVELLEKLSKVQAKPEEMKLFTSTSNMQTFGIKRCSELTIDETSNKKRLKVSNIKGINKKQNRLTEELNESDSDEDSSDSEPSEDEQSAPIMNIPAPAEEEASTNVDQNVSRKEAETFDKKKDVEIAVAEKVETKCAVEKVPTVFIRLQRKPEIQAAREGLPIFFEEQPIVEAIKENPVVIIHGETGSGKTTQVPQFLYEAGFTQNGKIIGITEPRRIAAMTMSSRVGEEMNAPVKVSYHIRYEKTVGKDTEIKFMTDGVLLKEIRHDFFLTRYSVIIIDEAHERSVFSDVLIGLLSRIIRIREKRKDPLKLIIMSATMRVEDFRDNDRLFKTQPILIRVNSRQHRVTLKFSTHTKEDYVKAAYEKVCDIHSERPPGAILVFLTGEKEVQQLCKMLRQTFPFKATSNVSQNQTEEQPPIATTAYKRHKKKKKEDESASFCDIVPNVDLDDFAVIPLDTEDLQHQMSDDEENEKPVHFEKKSSECEMPMYALPLYSILPFEEQEKVFKPPPAGCRLCVVATNVAETSITIPGLKYVVDSGKVKTKVYNSNGGGISKFEIDWCSKASANQRAGRCGRTEGGICWRLYSSAVFENDFPSFSLPEIQRIPVDDVLLQMKALGIDRVVGFPFPSPPDKEALKQAERRLVLLGALQDLQKGGRYKDLEKWEYSAKVTPLGKAMSRFPLSPRYAKMLLLSQKHDCIPYIVAIVCALTVPDLFVNSTVTTITDDGEEEVKIVQEAPKKIGTGLGRCQLLGDVMVLLRAVALFEESKHKAKFCEKYGIRFKAMAEIHKMSIQLLREMNRAFPDAQIALDTKVVPPDDALVVTIRKIVSACSMDHVARKLPREDTKDEKALKNAYKCLDCDEEVFIHPASTMFQCLPEFVVYTEIVQSTKLYMKGVVEIEAEWLPAFSPNLCDFSDPCEDPPPIYDSEKDKIYCSMGGTFGPWQWELPVVKMEMPQGLLKYSWFCFFFLDGQVCPSISSYKAHYLSTPSIMLKTWAKLLPRTRYLLQAIISKEVDTRESLRKIWKKDPKYLLREFWEWLPVDKHVEIELKWPPKI